MGEVMFHCYECGAQVDRSVWKSRCVACVVKKLKENLRENEELRERLDAAEAKNHTYEEYIDTLGDRSDTCVYNVTNKVCSFCQCKRKGGSDVRAE